MKPIYKSLALVATTLQISLALNAETRDDASASTMALQAELLDSLRVELVAQNVSGARNLIKSGECVIDGSNLTITLDTSEWTRGAMYRVQVLATFGTQTQVIYALNITVPYYAALSDTPQEFEDNVTIVSTITDVTEADLEGLALEETSQEIKTAIIPISQAAEAYDVGKEQLAAAITSKGVETSPTESYPEMAEKVNAISQETYEINGGEMYAKQLFGNLVTPNYWNLYEVLTQLLSDGRLVNYGGILLAEYYKGYDSLALSGAGAGGAYIVSDKDGDGNFIMYTEDTTHTWATEFDGKGNRWVAYCFVDEYHDFQITDTNTSPRSIFIGRKVGNIVFLVDTRTSDIIVPDGNELNSIVSNGHSMRMSREFCIRNIKDTSSFLYQGDISRTEKVYVQAKTLSNADYLFRTSVSLCYIIDIENIENSKITSEHSVYVSFAIIKSKRIITPGLNYGLFQQGGGGGSVKSMYILEIEEGRFSPVSHDTLNLEYMYISHSADNVKTKSVTLYSSYGGLNRVSDVELMNAWNKSLNISACPALTEANMYAHILQRLKQDEPDCGDGVTITLGSTNLAKLTSEESVQLLDDLTNIYGYTFA